MSDLFASPAAGTPRAAGIPAGESIARVVEPGPELAGLNSGESLRGTVIGKDAQGHLLVRTNLAVITLATNRLLPVGTEVVVQLRSVGPQVVVTLLPLQAGTAGPAAPTGQLAPTPAGQPAAPSLPPDPSDLVQRGQVVRAVLHATPPLPLLTGLPTAEPGTELIVRILSLGLPTDGGGAVAATTPGAPAASNTAGAMGATAGGAAPASGPTPGPATGVAPATPQGTAPVAPDVPSGQTAGAQTVGVQTGGVQTAGVQTGATTPKLPSPVLATAPAAAETAAGGTPAGAAPGLRLAPQVPVANSGHSLASALQAASSDAAARAAGALPTPAAAGAGNGAPAAPAPPAGSIPAEAAGSAAAGLRVTGLVTAATNGGQSIVHTPLGTMTLDGKAPLPVGTSLALEVALPTSDGPDPLPALAASWPGLGHLEQTLLHGLPPAQMQAVIHALPQVGPRLASGVLFFLSALNQGDVGNWLGPAAASLAPERGGRSDLVDRLGREFAALNRAIQTTAGDWRFISLPLWSDQGLRELRCFFRHQDHGGGQDGAGGERATRFVLELELQRHGALQLDGLVRPRRFDLMLRSRRALPAVVRGDLQALFEETNAIAGYSGQLVFQASHDWLQMLSAQPSATPHEGVSV